MDRLVGRAVSHQDLVELSTALNVSLGLMEDWCCGEVVGGSSWDGDG